MRFNTLTPKNPAVPAPIVMGTAENPMPVSLRASQSYALQQPGFSSPSNLAD
jgi:hypothetical protein